MDVMNNIATIVLTYGLIGIKDVIPYFIRKYGAKKDDGTYNEEMLKDINKDLGISFMRFPSDLIIISASGIFAKIIVCTKDILTANSNEIEQITMQLNTNHLYFWLIVCLMLPLFVLLTRFCESWYYPTRKVKPHKVKAVIINILLHLLALLFVLYVLFVR